MTKKKTPSRPDRKLSKKAKTPNLLRCRNSACDFEAPYKPDEEVPPGCPSCGAVVTIRCGSKLRKRDRLCAKPVAAGSRCRLHGGASLRGVASKRFKHGRYSRFIPKRYEETFSAAVDDPLAQREMTVQLALMEGLQEEALRRLGTGESGEAWAALSGLGDAVEKKLSEFDKAVRSADREKTAALATEILDSLRGEVLPAIRFGVGEEATRDELRRIFLDRARILRVKQQGERTVPIETIAVLQHRFAALLTEAITDAVQLRTVLDRLRAESGNDRWISAKKISSAA